MKLFTVALLALAAGDSVRALAASSPEAASRAELEAVCRTTRCRKPSPIRLKRVDGTVFEMTPDAPMPIVSGGLITVFPGETVTVEARVEGERLVDLAAVETSTHPERTLVFTLNQEPSIGDGTGMVLKVQSGFLGVPKYRLGLMRLDSHRLLKTSSCPLNQGQAAFEQWPEPISQIVASSFRFVDAASKDAKTCE